jgi:uncharacterized protein
VKSDRFTENVYKSNPMNPITIRYPFRPVRRSLALGQVADLFGLDTHETDHTIIENLQFDLNPQELLLITGPSGSGKSSILRAIGEQYHAIPAHEIELPNVPLIDALSGPVEDRLSLLASCGLSEARLVMRTPSELSDGQRYRFRIAYAMATAQSPVLLDEFTAMLDRTLAKVVAFNIRKLVTRYRVGIFAATTHDDIVEELNPDIWLRGEGDGQASIHRTSVKKKTLPSDINSGSRKAPDPTGRTSLGGITAPIISRSHDV